ncbi:lysine exporter LysO family protein [Aeromonas simiae]|uniref:Lysine exporter LysO family protein n=1 Tax=Aeromonas simiae TaxID=218936 RepID=A0A5J6WYI8_9GAMM|nr:lysine exporter LysO family protein [Aeromonas simiae]QFI55157.1 lysine exporter LysO family protein [Aeromonas simiae]
MLLNALLILLPLFVGYLIPVRSRSVLQLIQGTLSKMVYLILALMGMSLAGVDNLGSNMAVILNVSAVMLGCITLANLAALWWLDRRRGGAPQESAGPQPSKLKMMAESLQLALVVLGGFLMGLLLDLSALPIEQWSEWALMLLLLLIGIQMRNSGMHLRQILLNRWGMSIALCVMVSSWAGALLAALLLDLPPFDALALASSFGWYSLSGILVSDALGPVMGSAAFLGDLGRELLAIMLIPVLMRRHPSAAIGYGGATSLDFTLPVIQRSGGIAVVPVAVVSGFILSLLGPILVLFFLSL